MSDSEQSGFGKFVPGFDFLQNLAKGATTSIPQMPNLGSWVAPTLNVEELEKRIAELKGVHFWLEQNSRALGATIQALEVQKMTLATLKGMNFNIGDVANAIKLKAADSMYSGVQKVSERASSTAKHLSDAASGYMGSEAKSTDSKPSKAAAAAAGSFIDPMQLWGSLTQQFQAIAAGAIKEATTKTAMDVTKNMATGLAKEAIKSAKAAASAPPTKRPAAKKPSAKVAAKKPSTR